MKNLISKIANLPVGVIATCVGMATLSNVYLTLGYTGIRHVSMMIAAVIWIAAFIKITVHFKTFKQEYQNVVPASLYATFTMLTMILGSYIFSYQQTIGKAIWLTGVCLHILHILIFTYRNVIKGVKKETFIPSWFTSFNRCWNGYERANVIKMYCLLWNYSLYHYYPIYDYPYD